MVGNNFAPHINQYQSFVVQNVSPQKKVIRIFNYPIPYQFTRDLLKIPGLSESDIQASLLKGELNHKILVKDIIILQSDIGLLQFNTAHTDFLTAAGISSGLKVTPTQTSGIISDGDSVSYALKQSIPLIGSKNGINRTFFTPDNFLEGEFNDNIFHIEIKHNGRQLVKGIDFNISVTGGAGFNTVTFISFTPTSRSQLFVDYYVSTS